MSELLTAPTRRLIKSTGAQRVSVDAVNALNKTLEYKGYKIAEKAKLIAEHAGRKTIQTKDIDLALKTGDF